MEVKPLIFYRRDDVSTARSACRWYTIADMPSTYFGAVCGDRVVDSESVVHAFSHDDLTLERVGVYPTLVEAYAACQKHHADYIRSWLRMRESALEGVDLGKLSTLVLQLQQLCAAGSSLGMTVRRDEQARLLADVMQLLLYVDYLHDKLYGA